MQKNIIVLSFLSGVSVAALSIIGSKIDALKAVSSVTIFFGAGLIYGLFTVMSLYNMVSLKRTLENILAPHTNTPANATEGQPRVPARLPFFLLLAKPRLSMTLTRRSHSLDTTRYHHIFPPLPQRPAATN